MSCVLADLSLAVETYFLPLTRDVQWMSCRKWGNWEQMIWYGGWVLGWTWGNGVFNYQEGQEIFDIPKAPRLAVAHHPSTQFLCSCTVGTKGFSVWWNALRVELTIHLCLVLRLQMGGEVPPLSTCTFIVCIGTALPYEKYVY